MAGPPAAPVAYRGRLVLARGYGLANVEAGERVQPQTRFMLASVSKSITAATVLKVVGEGRLSLDASVLDLLNELTPPERATVDPRWRLITVEGCATKAAGTAGRAAIHSRGTNGSRAPCTSARR